jgi:chromosome partitioning protein
LAKILAVANQKGGVGKTTTCVNLAASLAATRKRVLMADLDPQGNATMGSGIDKYELEQSTYDVLVHQRPVAEVKCFSEAGAFDVLPANGDLTAAEVELIDTQHKEKRLEAALLAVRDDYDYILIDCPPSLNMLTLNGLVAADSVLIPMQCEYFALEGLSALMDTIQRVAASVNPGLHVEGLLRTMYDPRNSLTNDVSAQLQQHFGDRLYRTVIPRNVRLAEAPSFGVPAIQYDPRSRGAQAYLALAGELIRRQTGELPAEVATLGAMLADSVSEQD